jgi:TRAP-type C4-dicarboxylate transport system permease small subunit
MKVLEEFLGKVVKEVVNPIILLLSAISFIYFLWGIFKFVKNAGDEKARTEGRKAIGYGLIGLVIIFGAYGIINVAATMFGLPNVQKISQ